MGMVKRSILGPLSSSIVQVECLLCASVSFNLIIFCCFSGWKVYNIMQVMSVREMLFCSHKKSMRSNPLFWIFLFLKSPQI